MTKNKIIVISLTGALLFFAFAVQPGFFNMIGYAIAIGVFGNNSTGAENYTNIICYSFDTITAFLLFLVLRKILSPK